MKKDAKGITLIALVITIIVLLVLATVSIAMLTGENGLLKKATGAKEKNKVEEEKETIQLAYSSLKIDEIHNSKKITSENLKTEIEKSNNRIESTNSDINGNSTEMGDYAKITFKDTTNWYVVKLKSGKIEKYGVNGEIIKNEINVGNIEIYDIEDLQEFQKLVNEGNSYKEYTVQLMNDIDLSSICGENIGNWKPIGDYYTNNNLCFEGIFEGNNHTISNIYINDSNLECQGFFGEVKNGSIKNLTTSGNIKANRICGGIVGVISEAQSQTIENCTNNVNTETIGYCAGGIVGAIQNNTENVTIKKCNNNGQIKANTSSSGGILGIAELNSKCNIKNTSNFGDVTSKTYYAGGIVGTVRKYATIDIEKACNEGEIKAEGNDCAGGIVGAVLGTEGKSYINIEYAYNKGKVYAKVYSTGGILGVSYDGAEATIENSFNEGEISTGTGSYGGIVGSVNTAVGKISNCHNVGIINGSNRNKGAIIGYLLSSSYTGSSNYWLSTCGASYGIGNTKANTNATSLTADKMNIQTNFSGWDFSTIWKIDEAKGYPVLK